VVKRGEGSGVAKPKPWQGARPGSAAARQDAEDELLTLVAFDVASDKVRHRLGETCKDYGLARTQWSLFEGTMTRNRREELTVRLVAMIDAAEGGGRVGIYPIGTREAAWATRHSTLGPKAKKTGTGGAGS
jgi:CRISPR-associated protein Cas2